MLGSQRGTQRAWQDTIDRLKEAGDWEATAALWDARAENERLKNAIRRLADQDATLSVCDGAVTVTMDGTLTEAEREALDRARIAFRDMDHNDMTMQQIEDYEAICDLLERTK
jgi:hypothetical protein